jgi:DNA-binding transcriptional LysR family regulator
MNRLSDLTLFLRVLDFGSISAAARHLDVSVAVASQRLKRLERELGVRLLHRTTRQLRATTEGATLAKKGRILVEDLETLTMGLRDAANSVVGTLRLTTSASFGRQYISPLLPEFIARHPGARIHIDLNDRIVELVAAGFDLAIRIGALGDSTLVSQRLATNTRILCASPEYLRVHGRPKTPGDLKKHECLLLVGSEGRQDLWKFSDRSGRETAVRVSGRFETNFGDLVRDAAVAGLGISRHSTWHVCDDLRSGRLRIVLPNYPIADTGIHAVMPRRNLAPLRVRAFVNFLIEKFGEKPPWDRDPDSAACP